MRKTNFALEPSVLIRFRYNTKAEESPGGEYHWRVITENEDGSFKETLVKSLSVSVPSFSKEDDMPVVGRKYHMACKGVLVIEDGHGIIYA